MVSQFATSNSSASGYVTLPGGMILERGSGVVGTVTSNPLTVTLPVAFTTTNYSVTVSEANASGWSSSATVYGVSGQTTTSFTVKGVGLSSGGGLTGCTTCNFSWIAIGK